MFDMLKKERMIFSKGNGKRHKAKVPQNKPSLFCQERGKQAKALRDCIKLEKGTRKFWGSVH